MAVILAAYHKGKLVAQCNSNCHLATTTACSCICGGRFHGLGRKIWKRYKTLDITAIRKELASQDLIILTADELGTTTPEFPL